MTFEQQLIVELIGMIKWAAVGVLLITYAFYHINKTAKMKSVNAVRLITLTGNILAGKTKEGVDYLIKELEEKRPRE